MDTIRTFRDDPDLYLMSIGEAQDPYREEASVMLYAGNDGYEYWYDPDDDVLVHAAPRTDGDPHARQTPEDRRRPVPELRELALDLAGRCIPGFRTLRAHLHPLEANRDGEVFFFRWDDLSSPLPESVLPPFLQIGLHADGQLATYTDTLTR